MEILLRRHEGNLYVWKEATFNRDEYCVDGVRIPQTNILAVKGSNGGKIVRCKYCGDKMEDNPEAIEKHFVEQEAKRDCLKCYNKQFYNKSTPSRVIAKGEDGLYHVRENYTASIRCTHSWADVETETAASACIHNQHRRMGVEAVGGWLIDYPDLFAKQITVEALKAKGYEFCRRYDGYFVYDMKMRGTMHAYVDEYGIVDHFIASYNGRTKEFYYSATCDKLFYNNSYEYNDGIPYNWGETKYNAVRKKIANLYKEEKK